MKRLMLATAIALATSSAQAGPFGLDMGMSKEQVERVVGKLEPAKRPTAYMTLSFANGHPDFTGYAFNIDPVMGLARISAFGRTIDTDTNGTELKQNYNKISRQLSAKYGPPSNSFNFAKAGGIYTEPHEWMNALKYKERTLSTYWTKVKDDRLASVGIEAQSVGAREGYVIVSYEFHNWDALIEKLDKAEGSKL